MLPIDFLSQPIWQRLGLALLHFLWQGLLVAILAREIVRVFRIGHGTTRYAVYLFAFLAMAACPVGTFLMLGNRTQVDPARLASSLNLERLTGKDPQLPTAVSAEPKAITPNLVTRALDRPSEDITHAEPPLTITGSPEKIPLVTSLRDGFRNSLDAVLPWTIVVLVVGVIVLSFRLLLGFVGVSRWRRRLEQLPDSPKQRIICLSGRLGMRGFSRVFVSPFVRLPTAIGYFRPMILLPAAMLTQLPPEMLEAIIAHELAHIRRFDLWVNLMQRIVETLLFYHPVVWWLSNRLRNEREFCCDELAAKAAGNRRTYATALEYAGRAELAANRPALAVGLGQRKMAILARVRHVLGISSPPKRSRYWLAGVLTLAAAITLGIVAQIAVTGSDAKAKTISEPARQTTVRSADIDTIKKLAGQLAKMAWDEWTTALASAKALIEQQPAVEMHVFEPLFEPLFSKVGWGGIGRRESRTAADLLARIGKPTVGFLLEKLKSTEARQRWSAIQILTEIGEPDAPVLSAIRPLLSDKDDYVRRVAIESLGKLGENARPAAEDLKAAFNDTSVINQIFARAAYIRIGRSKPEHIRAIAKYLKSRDTKDEVGGGSAAAVAASVLGDLGPAAIIAAPDLIAALNHPQSQIRINAAHALGCIGADSNQAIDGLIDRLKNDTSRHIRRSAATSLGRIGRKAQDAIPVLAKALREADKESRNDRKTDRTGWWVAARAVGQIGGANAIPVLEESLKNNDPDIRSTAAKALEKIQQEAKTPPTPPDTQPVEKIGEPALADAAAKAMESLPAQNSFRGITVSIRAKKSVYEPGSIFEIVGTISTDREHTMYNAYWDLKKPVPGRLFVYDEAGNQILEFYDPRHHIGSSTGATKSACRKYKPGQTQQIFLRQYLAFRSADSLLPPGRYKVQLALNGLLLWEPQEYVAHDEVPQDLDQRMVAYSNVVDIEIEGEAVFRGKTLTQWIEALKSSDISVRKHAVQAMWSIGPAPRSAVPALIEALRDESEEVRSGICSALGEIGPEAASSVPSLIMALKDEYWFVRSGAARALGKIGDKRAVEPLITSLEDIDHMVRKSAAQSLGNLGDIRALEPLKAAAKDSDRELRKTAAWALEQVKPATQPQLEQHAWEQIVAMASEADLIVVAIKEQHIDNRFEIKQILKGSGHVTFEQLEKINGMDMPPADETKQWIMFLRVERERGCRLYPLVPTGWFVPYSKGLAQKILEAIPLPTRWGPAEGGLRMGLRMRKSHVALGEDIPVEIHIQNISQKDITLYQHLMPVYGYHPYTSFEVVTPDEKRWKLGRGLGKMSEYDFTPALELSPGETYIHMVRLNKWAVEREPLKPGEKFNLFTPGSHKITCTYSVEPKPDYIHPWNPPKNAWSGTLTSAPITLKIVEAKDASAASQPQLEGDEWERLAAMSSKADLVVVAENPWQYDRLYAKQVLKGSKVSFSNIQEINGIEKPPTDKNKQWILFLRIEQDHNLLLSPVTPSGWFAPYSEELAQRVLAAIPQPETWGETKDGLRMGLRLRKSHFYVGEDVPVEICIQNVSTKALTLYQHRYNNREYDYYPFTRFVVEFSDGRRLELYKPTLYISDFDSPSARTLSPGETYIHTVDLNEWTDWYEPAPKPGEKAELFTPGTFKITCTYSVERNPSMVPEPAHPKNAWSGTLTSSPVELQIIPTENKKISNKYKRREFLPDAVANRFIDAIRKRNYSFLTEEQLGLLRQDIRHFTAMNLPALILSPQREALLAAIDQYVPDYFLNRGLDFPEDFESDFDLERAYLKFRDQVNTFKWKLWLALTRKPHTPEELKQRESQHKWLREYIAKVPIRAGDGVPIGVTRDGVRAWASKYLERRFTDALSLLYDPMADSQFEVFKKLMKRTANGLYNTVTDIPVRALSARVPQRPDAQKMYGYAFDIQLPFQDEAVQIWGGMDAHLAFASNAVFRGRYWHLDGRRSISVFDVVRCVGSQVPAEVHEKDPDNLKIDQWAQKQGKGDLVFNDTTAQITALRGAKFAELKVANWFEADCVSDAELRELIAEKGQTTMSVKRLPPVNRTRPVGVTDPRFFIVVQTREKRLAVIDLKTREFGQVQLWSRPRPADSTISAAVTKPVTKGVVRETIKYLQIDGRRREVNWMLRVITSDDPSSKMYHKSNWLLRRGDQANEEHIALIIAGMGKVYDIKASPSGHYLAILSIGEGAQMLEVVDLPLLLMEKKYKVLRTIDPFPGGVAIERWDGDKLVITSGALLTYIGEDGRVPHPSLGWMSPQKYALSVESGGIEALSEGAKNPVEYFIRKLSSSHPWERQDAAMALKELKAKSAIGALKKAVAVESYPGGRAFMQEIVDELEKLPKGREKPAAVLRWVDDETGQMLFTVRDIVRFDWEQQIFELSRRRAMDLLANQYGLSRPFRVYDSSGVIYRGTFVSSAASMTFDGPVIVVGSIIKNIQPPLYRIDGGYPQGPERDEIRFSERMKMALADAGVFCEIDLTRPPAPFTSIMSEWAGEKEGQRVLVELFPETFQIGEMARIHVHFVGGKHLSEDAHAIEVNATVKANNGEFEYTVQRIFPIGRDGWKKVYVLESMPWGPVLASPDAYTKPGPAEVSVQVSTKRTLYTKMGSYSDLINTIKIRPMKVTILPQDRDVQPTERPSASVVPDLLRERDRLLAQADAAIRDGIVELAEKFPQLKRAKAWGSISVRSEPGRIGIYFYRTDPGSKPAVRKREDYGVMVDVRPIPSDVQEFQLGMDPIYPNLGLVGLVGASAGDAELDAALNKLIEKALTPLKRLNEKGGIDAQLNRTFEYGVGESNEPAISDGNSLLLPGSRISIRQAVTEPEFLFAAVCEAVDEALILGKDLGTNHAFQRFKIVELLTKEGHLPGQMIDLAYIYTDCPGLREHKIIKGQQVIWLVHSPKDTSFFTGRKALVDTPQNRKAVQEAATELEQEARWKTYLLAESGHIKVKLLIKENASPSDVEWMRLDFENTGSKQMRVEDARYGISRETFDLTTDKPVSSGGLASGKTYDLFHDAWKTTPISPIFLAPGMYSVTDHPSYYSMALLGVPDKGGWRVEGTVRLSVQLANGNVLSTPEEGVRISFNWLYPDEAGFEAMRKRLRDLLLKPDNYIQHAFAIGALLSSPEVAKSLTVEELLDGIARREGGFDGRDELVKIVNGEYANDSKVIDFYKTALKQNDWAAVSDLSRVATDVFDESFVEPLVKMNELAKGVNPNHKNVLAVLSRYYSRWKNDLTIAPRLSMTIVKHYPEVKAEPDYQSESQLIRWVTAIELLGMTHDKDMVSVLQPFLDCKTTVITYEGGAMLLRGVVPVPQRACDTAYNAIMTLLDKKQQKWNLGPGLLGNRQAWACKDQNDVRNVLRKRDELIRALEIKLTDITSERGRDSSQGDGLAAQRSGELKRLVRKAIDLPVRDARGPGKNEQNPTGLDFSRILDLTGQKTDVEGFTKDHRMYRRDVRRLVAKKKTWALCALLDHPNIDAKILAARELTYLNDPKNVPALLAAAKSNNYPVDGSENATVHANFRSILKQALQKITGLSLTPKGLKVTSYPKPSQPKVIYSDDDPSYFKEEIDFKKVESWLNTRFFDDSLPIVQKSNVQVEGEGEKNETVQSKAFTESALINALECGNSLVIAKILSVRANKETKPGKFYFYKTKVIEPIIIGDLSSTFAILYDYAAWLR